MIRNKLIFLIYDSRSGSTFLSAHLNCYKCISVSQESSFIHRIIEYGKIIKRGDLDKLFQFLSTEIQFNELKIDIENVKTILSKYEKEIIPKKKIIEIILAEYFKHYSGHSSIQIVKLGDYLYMKEILQIFPDSIFIQIIRDARAVYYSKSQNLDLYGNYMEINPLHSAWSWNQKLNKAKLFKCRVISVKYENLIANFDIEMNHILKFLNVPESCHQKTKQPDDYLNSIGLKQKRLHRNIVKKPDIDIANKWLENLGLNERMVITYWCKNNLKINGYPTDNYSLLNIYYHSVIYFIKFFAVKCTNIVKLINQPTLLFLKIKRKMNLLFFS